MTVHKLSRADARRIAVRAQFLDSRRPAGLLDAVRRPTLPQIDPTAAIVPNADLVTWSRLRPGDGVVGEPQNILQTIDGCAVLSRA